MICDRLDNFVLFTVHGSVFTSARFGVSYRFDLHGHQGFTFILIRADPKCDVPRRWRQGIRDSLKKNCASMTIALTQTKDEMFIVHYPWRCDRLDLARQENRLGIAVSERLQHFV